MNARTHSPSAAGKTFLVISVPLIFVVYPLAGFYLEHGYLSLDEFFNAPVHGNYRYIFWDLILDVDHLVANFITNLVFCLVFSFFCLNYGQPRQELATLLSTRPTTRDIVPSAIGATVAARYRRRCRVTGSIAGGILACAIFLSFIGVGVDRPSLEGKTLEMLFLNFHPGYFSTQLWYYVLLFSGLPGMFYLLLHARGKARKRAWKQDWSNPGLVYLVVALTITSILAISSPLDAWQVLNPGDPAREFLFSLLDCLFLTGLISWLEARDLGTLTSINKGILAPGKGDTRNGRGKRLTPFCLHSIAWFVAFAASVVLLGAIVAVQEVNIRISVWLFLSRTWSFWFNTCLVVFLVSLGRARMAMKGLADQERAGTGKVPGENLLITGKGGE